MRVLVAGGAGFIGRHLVRRLAESGHDVVVVDDLSRHGTGSAGEPGVMPHTTFIRADVTDPATMALLPRDVDRVYHLAAIVGVGPVSSSPLRVMRVNTATTLHLCDWFVQQCAPGARFLYSSSSEVYSGAHLAGTGLAVPTAEDVPFVINDPTNPRFSYAASKIWGEMYCRFAAKESGRDFRTVRYHNVYGPAMGYDHAIPQIICRILDREDPFRVFGADETRAFCWVEDAVEATIRVMEAPMSDHTTVVHVGSPVETPVRRLYDLLFELHGWTPARLDMRESPPGSVPRRCPDVTRLAALTGYVPSTPLAVGLDTTSRWYGEHRKASVAL